MKRFLVIVTLVLYVFPQAGAEDKTFIRDYYYQASENDSKVSSRNKALLEVKRLMLEEIGVYIESYVNYGIEQLGDSISNQFLRKEIEQISAGITETTILEENWNGVEYYVKAQISLDPEDVIRQLNHSLERRKASVVVDSLNMLLSDAKYSLQSKDSEISLLRDSLEAEQRELTVRENNIIKLRNELDSLKYKYSYYEQQEKEVLSEIDKIKESFREVSSYAENILVGMTMDEVKKICGEPRGVSENIDLDHTIGSWMNAWDYGFITIIFDNKARIVRKGIKTSDYIKYGYEGSKNIINSLLYE